MVDSSSWSVHTHSPESLNLAMYVACYYGLLHGETEIDEEELWPEKQMELDSQDLALLQKQWRAWWHALLADRYQQSKNGRELPVSFLPNSKLDEYGKSIYPAFVKWWEMPAGGKTALQHYESLFANKLFSYIQQFEMQAGRKVKPFTLRIEYVYTGFREKIETHPDYVLTTPKQMIMLDKNWWMAKLERM